MADEQNEGRDLLSDTAQHPRVELSPDEKLEENSTIASPVPGAQTAENTEVKKEFNPNTE
ncbi:MAG TPA: hypothetical protein VK421_01335 [Pyrinomonadaceae bacterium]|nr:hypothetical protein [Pyrinomonadaceae bacterium]